MPPNKFLIVGALGALGVATLLMRSTYVNADWSPYYKVEVEPYERLKNERLGYKIIVDNLSIQDALNLSRGSGITSSRIILPNRQKCSCSAPVRAMRRV